ncbi:MAG: hypothetical protein RIT27_1192 [Pseudomonadota bacterium]|jgi:hypothetical protein
MKSNKIKILCGIILATQASFSLAENTPKPVKWNNQGLIDGLYECDVTEPSNTSSAARRNIKATRRSTTENAPYRKILSFSGKSDGSLLYTVGKTGVQASDENTELSGYGVGSIATGQLIGSTWNGGAFQMGLVSLNDANNDGTYDGLTVKGTIFIRNDAKTNQPVNANIVCRKAESLSNLLK